MLNRRTFLAATASAATAACAPAAAPVQETNAPSGNRAAWEQEWDRLVADAKKEGTLGVLSLVGGGYRTSLDAFEKAFGIQVEHQNAPSATVWVPKLEQERAAGIYQLDVAVIPPNSALTRVRNAWDPIKPAIFRPDVLDDKAWRDGFTARFMDVDKQLAFDWEYNVQHTVGINTDLVKEGEIKEIKDLVDPKWRGKLYMIDPRFGDGYLTMSNVRKRLGDQFVKQLLVDQQPVFSRDPRQVAEAIIRGRYAIGTGMRAVVLQEFKEQGLTRTLKLMDWVETDFVPATSLLLANKAPHPNAAKLFANWFLTKEGQTIFAKNLPTNSARTDVEIFHPDGAGAAGKSYYETGHEANYAWIEETQKFINGLVGIAN